MDNQQLIEYLRMVLEVEKNIYTRNDLIATLEEKIDNLQKPTEPIKPKKIFSPLNPIQPNSAKYSKFFLRAMWTFIFASFLCFLASMTWGVVICAGIAFIFYMAFQQYESKPETRNYNLAVRNYFDEIHKFEKEKKKYESDLNHYNEQMISYNNLYSEYTEKVLYYKEQIQALEQGNKESESHLERLYNQGILYYNYRNLVAVAALFEYIESGRCSSLEGSHGAYNKFDNDLNNDTIIKLLNTIISNQEREIELLSNINNSIKQVGRTLYRLESSINDIKKNTSKIESSVDTVVNQLNNVQESLDQQNEHLKQIKINSAITAYNQDQSRKEIEYLRRMDDLEKGRWLNP